MSVQSEITRIETNIDNAYNTLEEMGATMPTNENSANLASTIASLGGQYAPTGHTHSMSDLTQGYANIHPENSGSIIPFINNDLAFLSKKGGSYSVYSTTSTDFTQPLLLSGSLGLSGTDNMFDGSPSYAMITTTGQFTAVIDMTLHKTFTYSNQFYIDFGAVGWRTKGIAVYVMNSNTETKYVLKNSTTTNAKGNWYCGVSHSSKNSSGTTVQGFNKLRVVLTNFNNTSSTSGKRIAQVGLLNYGSAGVTETFVSRGGSTMYGDLNTKNLYPTATNASNLGSSSKQYNTIYGKTIYENGTALSSKYAGTSAATQSAAGLMSAADKKKLDGIAEGANNSSYTLPAAGSSLGGVKTGGDVTISDGVITVNDDSHNHTIANVDGLQTALDGKAATHSHPYVPLSGGTMTGAITLPENTLSALYSVRSGWQASQWHTSTGDEAMIFQQQNPRQSWIFRYGTDTTPFTEITPSMQIKNGGVAINKMFATGTTAPITYNLDVNGTANATTIYENGTALSSKYASLDKGKVVSSQLPSYVDDVLEYSAKSSFPATGETGKIYVDTSTNITYRWSGSAYVAIGSDLALGETSATAYRGDRGKTAYDHSQKTSGNPHGVTKSDVGLGSVENKSSATIRGEITKANVTSALGYTPTSDAVVPNNSGDIKTKFRVSLKADAGRTVGTYRYYKLCDLPTNDTGNYASAIISGRIGGWTSGDMSYINALVWNRNTPGMALIDIAGGASNMSSIWNTCELVLYVNGTSAGAANTATLYAKCYSWFTFDLDIEMFQSTASITYDGTYITTTPSGTLAAQSSTSTKRLELINGVLQVNGKKVITADAYSLSGTTLTITTS